MNQDGVRRQGNPPDGELSRESGGEPGRELGGGLDREPGQLGSGGAEGSYDTERVPLHLVVNGAERTFQVRMHDSLLDVLRREGYAGAKRVCETADCGACSVLMDGLLVDSCATLALQAEGRAIETIEGLADRAGLHPLQAAFLRHAAVQCGFCIPGMILAVKALLERRPRASAAEIRAVLPICRCTGYVKPVQAALDYQAGRGGRATEPT